MKTKFTSKFIMLILSVVMTATLCVSLAVSAFAAEGDLCTSTDSCTGTYANGFCSVCNGYEPAALNANGYYEIANAGQLFWFAQQVNVEGNREIKGVLTADIDLENRPWTPIGAMGEENSFRGVFDGDGHTITGLNVTAASNGAGFFGEVRTGTVKNFTIYGEVIVNTEVDYVGGVIGSICGLDGETDLERNGAIIQNITSYVNLTAKAHGVGMIGGFVGYANHQSLIENCSWYGTFDAGEYRVDSGAGGFIGKIQEDTGEVTIRNCAAYGTIKTNYAGDYNNTPTIYMGGFLSYSAANATTTLENCLFAGKFERGANLTDEAYLGAFGTLDSVQAIKNCYYLGDDGLLAVHSNSPLKPGSDNVEITSVTGAQLLSGEVAYKLGEHFGQTLEGENRQSYPVLGGTRVEDSQRFEIYGQQLNIGGDLSMKYYVMGYAPEFNSGALYMEFSHNGVKTKVYAGEPNADGFYVFTLEGINPQCMGDSIRAKLYYNETEVASHGCEDGKEYSVEKNLLNLLEKYKDDAALVALIKDTLAYGEAAGAYRDHQTMTGNAYIENSSNREIPVSELTTSPEGDLRVHQATVRFGTMNHIVLMIESKNGAPTVKVGDKSFDVTLHEENSNYYVSVLHGVSATDFGNDITVAISDGTTTIDYTVSINDYLYAISQSSTDEKMVNLAKALYNYGLSAHIVKGNHEGGEATCTHGKFCDICGLEYGEKDTTNHASDTYTYTDNGDGTHTKTHECGVTVGEPEDHTLTYTANGNTITVSCSVGCGYSGTATISATGKTYDGNAVEVVVSKTGSLENTDIPVTLTKDGEAFTGEPVNVGAYTASVTLGDKTVSIDFTIAKAVASITAAPTPNTLTYIGDSQYLINAGEADGGTMVYSLTEDGEYTTSIPQGTNAGDYTVWYYVQGDANHNDSAKASVSVSIAKAPLTVTADAKIKSYGDENPTLTYTAEGLLGGDTLTGALTGALSREEGENVGSYAITLGTLSADNYTISFEGAEFTIQAKEVTEPIVTLDQISYQYDGNVKEPKVISVVVDGRTLTEGIDYTVSYEDNVYVGEKATVVINFMGNYDGTFRKWFTITQDPNTTEFDGAWITIPKA